jgi:hypothetical protein
MVAENGLQVSPLQSTAQGQLGTPAHQVITSQGSLQSMTDQHRANASPCLQVGAQVWVHFTLQGIPCTQDKDLACIHLPPALLCTLGPCPRTTPHMHRALWHGLCF